MARKRFTRRSLYAPLVAAAAIVVCIFAGWLAIAKSKRQSLPFYGNSKSISNGQWQAYGGTWDVVKGSLRNESTERGAKLITGDRRWTDYAMDADMQLLGPGDAGLLVRVSDAEKGVDAYTGYYIGLRSLTGAFFIGRARHGWQEYPATTLPGGVKPFEWYHLHVAISGCQLEAKVTARASGEASVLRLTADECYPQGQVGLRSYSAGGVWRNVVVSALKDPQTQGRAAAAALPVTDPVLLARNIRGSYLHSIGAGMDPSAPEGHPTVQPISALRLLTGSLGKPTTVRGVVILATPSLFVQDATGGVAVQHGHGPPLKVGDEVEVQGQPFSTGFHSVLRDASVRLLWEGEPPPPYAVTLNQAAGGAYDSTFVELEGMLRAKRKGLSGTLLLDMEGRSQSFQAILNPGRSSALFRTLKTGSTLRLRGICVTDAEYTSNMEPFALLVRSVEDVTVVAGPPWWSWYFLMRILLGVTVLALVAYILYLRARNWRVEAVLEERGRLAHEIHDTLAQSFAGIGFQLQAIRKRLPAGDAVLNEQVELACALVRHSHEETRRSIATLRHEPTTEATLHGSLRQCVSRMVGNGSLSVDVSTAGQACILPLQIESALLRIGQEATANAVSHSGASNLAIRIAYERDAVTLQVKDDGCGFRPESASSGLGLAGIRSRAASIGATISVSSEPGRGTCVKVTAPVSQRSRWRDALIPRRRSTAARKEMQSA